MAMTHKTKLTNSHFKHKVTAVTSSMACNSALCIVQFTDNWLIVHICNINCLYFFHIIPSYEMFNWLNVCYVTNYNSYHQNVTETNTATKYSSWNSLQLKCTQNTTISLPFCYWVLIINLNSDFNILTNSSQIYHCATQFPLYVMQR